MHASLYVCDLSKTLKFRFYIYIKFLDTNSCKVHDHIVENLFEFVIQLHYSHHPNNKYLIHADNKNNKNEVKDDYFLFEQEKDRFHVVNLFDSVATFFQKRIIQIGVITFLNIFEIATIIVSVDFFVSFFDCMMILMSSLSPLFDVVVVNMAFNAFNSIDIAVIISITHYHFVD